MFFLYVRKQLPPTATGFTVSDPATADATLVAKSYEQAKQHMILRASQAAHEVIRAQEAWARQAFPSLVYFHEVDKGGHFAACEYPELFSAELLAAFKSARRPIGNTGVKTPSGR
jgi:pimeloyl-ACP methyl ester carboxylesterase